MRGTLFALSFFHSKQVGIEANVFVDGEVFIKPEALRHIAQAMLGAFGIASDIEISDTGRPFIGRHNAGEHAERCRFSRAVGTDQAENFAGAHVKAQVIDRKYAWKALW